MGGAKAAELDRPLVEPGVRVGKRDRRNGHVLTTKPHRPKGHVLTTKPHRQSGHGSTASAAILAACRRASGLIRSACVRMPPQVVLSVQT